MSSVDSFIGKKIDNYRVVDELGSGSYGSVYKAEHNRIQGHFVAIKLLRTRLSSPYE